MFETSFLLFSEHLLLNIFIPFIPWLLFLWIFYGTKIKWILLYLLSRFVWVWVVAFSLLNIQFIHFWVWILEYFIILWILLITFVIKIFVKKQSIKDYIDTLKLKNIFPELKISFKSLSLAEKVFTIILSVFSVYFICISGIFNFNLPTYADDSFGNWDKPAHNIYTDWWIKLFWDESEILWRWRLWYPIHMPTYKALISNFTWWVNDIYFNTWQRLVFVFWLLFIFSITFDKTKNIFKSILPIWLICCLPLVFFHSFEWYMELPCTIYSIITIWIIYKFLERKDYSYLSISILLCCILSHIKNDGLLGYAAWIVISLIITLIINKELLSVIKTFVRDKKELYKSIFYIIYFLIPFLIIRFINNLSLNPVAWTDTTSFVHREIFNQYSHIFFMMDNYNIILVIIFILLSLLFLQRKIHKNNNMFLILPWLLIFLIFTAVFLFTENYLFILDQTTVNRVYTMAFAITIAFSWIILQKHE